MYGALHERMRKLRRRVNAALESATGYRLVASSRRAPDVTDSVQGGLVEEFSPSRVNGWVVAPVAGDPLRVSILVNGHEVATTWATDGVSEDGLHERRGFDFVLRDIWAYCKSRDRLSVTAAGETLPISGHGMYISPTEDGPRDTAALLAKLRDGHVFGQYGRLQRSKRFDTVWQASVMSLYARVREILREDYGYDPFLIYGTLLGAVREGGVIGHDVDFDCAYLSRHVEGADAAAELRDIAFRLIERGMDVDGKRSALHIHDSANHAVRIDLFHVYFDQGGLLRFPFGVAGTTEVPMADWHGTQQIEFCGAPALIPANAEQIVEHIYGSGWRSPKPGFDWNRDRKKRDSAGILPVSYGQEVYWSNFYARHELGEGSPFFHAVSTRPDSPVAVLDIGCGDGRDALAFAAAGRSVLGLDRSAVAVEHAIERGASLGLDGRVNFAVCDVTDATAFSKHVASVAEMAGGPMLFYLRFFLHSIPEEVQETLLTSISKSSRPGDMLAAEFRTDQDEQLQKTFPKHYRRYQDGPAFGATLKERFGFEVLDEMEGQGLSPYGDEDPHLYRVIARRT